MDKAIKKKWLKALRSGNYKKGIGNLCKIRNGEACYCALGVLVEEMEGEGVWEKCLFPYNRMHVSGYEFMPPLHIRGPAGLSNQQCEKIAELNDCSKGFDKVVDYIEANL